MRANDLPVAVPSNRFEDVRWHWLWFHTQSCPYDRFVKDCPTLLLHTSRPIFIEFSTLANKVLDTRARIA
jgi:hypothetical protein